MPKMEVLPPADPVTGTGLVSPFAVCPPEAILNLPEGHLGQELGLDERQLSIEPTIRSMTLDPSFVMRMVSAHTCASTLTGNSCSMSSKDPLHISMGTSTGPASSEFLPLLPEDFMRATTLASVDDDGLPVVTLTPPPAAPTGAAPGALLPHSYLKKRVCSRRIGDNDSLEFTQPPAKLTTPAAPLPASPRSILPGLDGPSTPPAVAPGTAPGCSAGAATAGLPHRPVGWNPRLKSSLEVNRKRRGNRLSIASLDEAVSAAGVTAALAAVAITGGGGGGGGDVVDQGSSPRESLDSWLEDDILAEARSWLA